MTEPKIGRENVPPKFFTVGLHETPEGVGVSITITSFDAAETIVFTPSEASEAWQLIRGTTEKAEQVNEQRRLDNL